MDQFRLTGKVAIVTGAARGIGLAAAQAFVAAGIKHVVCADRREPELSEVETSDQLSTALLDVADQDAWTDLVSRVEAAHGSVDILVNNAGVIRFATIEDTDPQMLKLLLDVNVVGVLLGMKACIPGMKAKGSGSIINISSASAIAPSNAVGAYAASKYAVRGLSRSAALELGPLGIRVNSIHPGGVNTKMTNPGGVPAAEKDLDFLFTPARRATMPAEIANGIVYLASDASLHCMGTELVIDGGMTAGIYFRGLPGDPEL